MTDTPTPSIEEVAARTKRRAEAMILMHPVKGRPDFGPFADRDGHWGYGPFAEDALATITALQSELERRDARIGQLESALKPFADRSIGNENEVPDDATIFARTNEYPMSDELRTRLAGHGTVTADSRISAIVSFDGLRVADFRFANATLKDRPNTSGEA